MKYYLDGLSLGAILTLGIPGSHSSCPYLSKQQVQHNPHFLKQGRKLDLQEGEKHGDGGVPEAGGFAAVQKDLEDLLVDSKDFFPADNGNYAGLMIRLAWHCSGSYRVSDGRGGCDGGRIRFDPELNWEDNGNLNHALALLEPVKEKYGGSLSWGDLIILAGNTAISSTGGPILGFCGGRIDDEDGAASLKLGPTEEQEEIMPCKDIGEDGHCKSPLGQTTLGLIYVNPAGPEGATGNTLESGKDIRDSFGRMGFNDTQTVAIVGGGHAYGKAHGACLEPPCGADTAEEGVGGNTYTSGFEGPWTTTPTQWSNQYFQNMFSFNWTNITGPGGQFQWAPIIGDDSVVAPRAAQIPGGLMMLTADLALRDDPIYNEISRLYSEDIAALEHDFKHAWYALTTRDMGPAKRCIGDQVPSPQDFQLQLPEAQDGYDPDFIAIRSSIQNLIDEDEGNIAAFSNLAYRCASTYRETDYKGGCNGARIRFPPESEWESNAGTSDAISILQAVKDEYDEISYADLIVLAGQAAIESASENKIAMAFCAGRVDAENADGSDILAPRVYFPHVASIRDDMEVKGLTTREGVALAARPMGTTLSNEFYVNLVAGDGDFSPEELALLEGEFKDIVDEYAADNDVFLHEFKHAWRHLMIADRFSGPFESACEGVRDPTLEGESEDKDKGEDEGEVGEGGEGKDEGEDEGEAKGKDDDSSAAWVTISILQLMGISAAFLNL